MGLFPGNYSLTVTDSQLEQATANFTINLLNAYDNWGAQFLYTTGYCPGQNSVAVVFTGQENSWSQPPPEGQYGPAPYTFAHPSMLSATQTAACNSAETPVYNVLEFQGLPPGYYNVDFWDGAGCPGQVQVVIPAAWNTFPQVQLLNVSPSCASTATGSVTYSMQGDLTYSYNVILRPEAVQDLCGSQVDMYLQQQYVQGGTRTVSNLFPGDYWLITTSDLLNLDVDNPYVNSCRDSVLVTVPSLGTDCGLLSGRVYIDENPDCIMGSGSTENRVPGTIVEITPGPIYLTTNSSGQYSIGLNFGDYTVTEQHPVFDQSCPGAVTLAAGSQTFNVGCAGGEPLDVQLAMANGWARPGFELHYGIDLDNLTPAATGNVTLTVTIDPALSFLSATPAPTSVVGNVLTWTSPQLVMSQVFEHKDIGVRTQVPPDVGLIGSTLTTTAQLVTANADGDLANNSAVSDQLVTGSFDPNDKTASTSLGSSSTWIINEDNWIDYTIRFQNTGTDTAFNVIITDTLPPTLDPASIIWGAGSHAHSRALAGQGVLKFIFSNILLPDSNVNEPLSHGFVGFRIRPHLPVEPGNLIENIANIYFDFNPPVITEPSVLVAEFSTGVGEHVEPGVAVAPNPVSTLLSIAAASPIARLRIVSADGRVVHSAGMIADRATMDVAALKSGAYTVIAELHNGSIARASFIKLDP